MTALRGAVAAIRCGFPSAAPAAAALGTARDTIWIAPYGQFRSHSPHPMQWSSITTSSRFPCRWIASTGHPSMQYGF